ncbi:hypothetical protein CYMTET_12496 [Cymbomonas tetramitiformis]|uniref:RNA-directed DNA polymerase n=1 Tax=Cymbomonas tetramitiformis TaxID=36881 RepID=A0AAE0LCD9_9CHLO|nr:hypothetical protein CYMTET_12496 [Cymbomonas tetramitiformis]
MADEVAKKACEEGEYGLNHDNTDTVMLLAISEDTGRQLEGHQAILNHVTKKVREAKMTGETNIIQRLKRKLETGPEEWETKRQRIERVEAEYAQKSRELTEIEIVEAWADSWPDEPERQQEQEEELELQRMERQEEEALRQEQQVQTARQAKQKRGYRQESTQEAELSKEEAGETRTKRKEGALGQGRRQKRRRTRNQTEPDQPALREVEGQREVQGEVARGPTQAPKLPEAQNKDVTTQEDTAAELSEMAQQQDEAQEEWRALQEMAQQQEAAQQEAHQAREWRRTSIEKILTATREKPEKYMQHLKGDKAMHKLSNEYWKKGTEYLNEHDVTVLLRCRANKLPAGPYKKQQGGGRAQKCKCCGMPRQVNTGGFIRTAHVLGGCTEREIKNMVISRLDGRNTPAPEHGKDTIPHYVDIVMLEGTEKGNEQPGYTHQKAMAEAGHIHLIEVTYTDEMSWEEALKTKYTKYTPLVKLLELYGYKVTLHVMGDGQVNWEWQELPVDTPGESLLAAEGSDRPRTMDQGPLLLVFWAVLKGRRVKVMVDTGATNCFISEEAAVRCGLPLRRTDALRVSLADGSVKTSDTAAFGKLACTTSRGSYAETLKMRVLKIGVQVDVVLGGSWLRSLSPVLLDYQGWGSIPFQHRGKAVTIVGGSPGRAASPRDKRAVHLTEEVFLEPTRARRELAKYRRRFGNDADAGHDALVVLPARTEGRPAVVAAMESGATPHLGGGTGESSGESSLTPSSQSAPVSSSSSSEEEEDAAVPARDQQAMQELLAEFQDVIVEDLPLNAVLGSSKQRAHIRLKEDWNQVPPAQRHYKMSHQELEQLWARLDELLSKGYIRPSSSPYAAPCLMVPKPNNPKELRLVIDYRRLNGVTVQNRFPLPDIQQMFDDMQGCVVFSSADVRHGFWQMPMAEEDVEKTAFVSHYGSYEWLVLPMGLTNSPSSYQSMMTQAFRSLPFVRVFIDDVICFSRSVREHLDHLRQMLSVCRNPECPIYFSKSKMKFMKSRLKFLGHVVGEEGCRLQQDKVAAVRDWPPLSSITHVRQFLGLAGYYRKYIQGFSDLAQSLTRLTKSSVEWEWEPKEQAAQDAIKQRLIATPTLALPNMRAAAEGRSPFVVQTDASGVALGGVLMQDVGEGLRPIAYAGRQFSPAEQNYGTGERELCALHHCCTVAWRHYLVFTDFKLQGDHRPLEWLMSPGRELSRRQARWYMDLVEVGVPKMEWIPGRMLQVPDALSRRPDYQTTCPREGLKESGALNRETDLPEDPPGSQAAEGSRLSCLVLGGRKDPDSDWLDLGSLWMNALRVLDWAEEAHEGHAAPMVTRSQGKEPEWTPLTHSRLSHHPRRPPWGLRRKYRLSGESRTVRTGGSDKTSSRGSKSGSGISTWMPALTKADGIAGWTVTGQTA